MNEAYKKRNKIKQIQMSGIKGQEEKQDLTGRDIIIGNNGAGKTTRLQAMSLAALGYVPGKGKTAADTFELASEDTMTVGIDTELCGIFRSYIKSSKLASDGTRDVKITQKINVYPSEGERSNKEKEQRIIREVGDFPAMLDFGSFIELSDNKKRDFIYNLGGDRFTWNHAQVEESLREAVLTDALLENNPEMYDTMEDDFVEVMKQYSQETDVTSGLLAMGEYAKEQLSRWRKEKANADAAAQKLTEIKNRELETDRGLAENQEKLAAMKAEQSELIKTYAAAEAENRIHQSKTLELERLSADIEALENDSGTTEKADKLARDIEGYSITVRDTREQIESIHHHLDAMRQESKDISIRYKERQKYLDDLKQQLNHCDMTIQKESELIELITANAGCCVFSKDIKCSYDFSGFIAERQEIIDNAYTKKDELEPAIAEQSSLLLQMGEEGDQIEIDMERKCNETIDLQRKLRQFEVLIMTSQEDLQQLENSAPILTAKRQQAKDLTEWLEQNPSRDCGDYQIALQSLDENIKSLEDTIEKQKKIRNDIINIKSNVIDSQTATFQQECWKQIAEAIGQKGIQGEIVKEMLDPMRDLINEKLKAMGIEYSFYFRTESDRGKEVFEFGWSDQTARRPFSALSQGEQLLLLIAMMTTIIEQSNSKIRILAIDNINHLDHNNLQRVIHGLNEAGKNMDNIILAGTPDLTDEDAPGWKVWRI